MKNIFSVLALGVILATSGVMTGCGAKIFQGGASETDIEKAEAGGRLGGRNTARVLNISLKNRPSDLLKARQSAVAAQEVLLNPDPSIPKIEEALKNLDDDIAIEIASGIVDLKDFLTLLGVSITDVIEKGSIFEAGLKSYFATLIATLNVSEKFISIERIA